jgi:hypothetical protein
MEGLIERMSDCKLHDNLLMLGGSLVCCLLYNRSLPLPNEHSLNKYAFLGLYDDIST